MFLRHDESGEWAATEIAKEPLQRIVLSKRMMKDHLPDVVLDALQGAKRAEQRRHARPDNRPYSQPGGASEALT